MTHPQPAQSNPFLASSTFLAASVSLNPPLDTHTLDPSASSNLSSWSGHAHGQWCGKWTHARRRSVNMPAEQGKKNRHTQGVGTEVVVAVRARVIGLVQGRVAGIVLVLLLLVLVAAAAAAKHLVEEAKLRRDGAREGEEEEGEGAHFGGRGCGRDCGFGGEGVLIVGDDGIGLAGQFEVGPAGKGSRLSYRSTANRVTKQKIGRTQPSTVSIFGRTRDMPRPPLRTPIAAGKTASRIRCK